MVNYVSTNCVVSAGGGGADTVWAKPVNGETYEKGDKVFLDSAASIGNYAQSITGELRNQFLIFINNTQCCAVYHNGSAAGAADRTQGFYTFNEKTEVFDYSEVEMKTIYHGNIRGTVEGKWVFERGRYDQCDIVGELVKSFPTTSYTYLGEGYVINKNGKEFGLYDLDTDTFTTSGSLSVTLAGVALKTGKFLIGQTGTYTKTNYVFDISDVSNAIQTFKSSSTDNYYLTQAAGNMIFYAMYNGRTDGDGPFITNLYQHNIIRKLTANGELIDFEIPESLAPYTSYKWLYNPVNHILTCSGPADYKVFLVDEENETFTLLNIDLGVEFNEDDGLVLLSFSNDMRYAALTTSKNTSATTYYWDTSNRYLFKLDKEDNGLYAYKSATNLGDTLITGFATGNIDAEGKYEFEAVTK